MDPIAIGALLALASAGLHAAWNLRLKASDDPLRLAAQAIPIATLAATPFVATFWLVDGRPGLPVQGWLLAVASGGLELGYFHLLSAAYRRGEISSVYPVARGVAPVLAVATGVVVLGERLGPVQWAGVAALVGGVWLARPGAAGRLALAPALATGVAIAAYSAVDRLGVRTGPVWLYAWATFAAMAIFLAPWGRGPRQSSAPLVGLLTVAAYSLVLAALSIAPLAVVAPAREVGVVIVAVWGVYRLHEGDRAGAKLAGAGAVVMGGLLLVL